MMPRKTTAKRARGQWVAEVPGYGVLPVVHSDLTDFQTHRYREQFNEASADAAKLDAQLKAFEDNPGFVLVQKDAPRETAEEAYRSEGYVGVYAIKDFAYDDEDRLLEFTYIKREPVRLA